MSLKDQPIQRLQDRSAVIGVIGLGYVGLPLALRFAESSYTVLGFDVDASKPEEIALGLTYFQHIPNERVKKAVDNGFRATTDFYRASETDALIICVPTPLKAHREPDISFVSDTMDSIVPHMHPGQVVSLESTTYPGTTEEELWPQHCMPALSTRLCRLAQPA